MWGNRGQSSRWTAEWELELFNAGAELTQEELRRLSEQERMSREHWRVTNYQVQDSWFTCICQMCWATEYFDMPYLLIGSWLTITASLLPQNSISARPSEFPPNSLPAADRAGLWPQGFSFLHSIDKTLSQQEPSGVEGNYSNISNARMALDGWKASIW